MVRPRTTKSSKRTIQNQNLFYPLNFLLPLRNAFFFEVKIGEKFFAEEIRKTNSKIRWKIVAASLKRYVASGRRSLSALFRIYEQDSPSIGRVIERVSKTREPGKWKHWHGGNEKMAVISGEWRGISREITN